jgi:hypothetical protein
MSDSTTVDLSRSERIRLQREKSRAINDSLALVAANKEKAVKDSINNILEIENKKERETPHKGLRDFLQDNELIGQISGDPKFAKKIQETLATTGEDILKMEEKSALQKKEDIASQIATLNTHIELFEDEYKEFREDRDVVMKLKSELAETVKLRNLAHSQAYPEWHQTSFLDFTKDSDNQEKVYNELNEAVKLYEGKIGMYDSKWFRYMTSEQLEKTPQVKGLPFLEGRYQEMSKLGNRMNNMLLFKDIIDYNTMQLNVMREQYSSEYGFYSEDTEKELDIKTLIEDKKFEQELSSLYKSPTGGVGAIGGFK